MRVRVDAIGNIIAMREGTEDLAPVMCGSHIDTVATGGIFDGNLGVLAGLEVVEALADAGRATRRPIAIAVFSDEEGVRFAPDMLGSLVYAGGMGTEAAHDLVGIDGTRLRDELDRIGYLGAAPCPGPAPHAYVELHIEQGPVLEARGEVIGAVTGVQGISWQELTLRGQSNHAGTTPMVFRHDAGVAAAGVSLAVRAVTAELGGDQVGTVGRAGLHPDLVNVIAGSAVLTVDLRNTDEAGLQRAEERVAEEVERLCALEGVSFCWRRLARFEPVELDPRMVGLVEEAAVRLGHSVRRMPSGAGHDAQMLARVCPSGMVFVPSIGGVSHNPAERTAPEHVDAGLEVLADVMVALADAGPGEGALSGDMTRLR